MECEAGRLHVDRVACETAFDHDPADGSLQRTEKEHEYQRSYQLFGKSLLYEENGKWNCEGNCDEAAPKAVEPFPEKNEFEFAEREVHIDVSELWRLTVFFKFLRPLLFIQWWKKSCYHVPFSDGKSRACESSDAAQYHLHQQHGYTDHYPGSDGSCGGRACRYLHRVQR